MFNVTCNGKPTDIVNVSEVEARKTLDKAFTEANNILLQGYYHFVSYNRVLGILIIEDGLSNVYRMEEI